MGFSIDKGQEIIIAEIIELGRKNFKYNQTYQRSSIWETERKQRLIDSILQNLSIGNLMLKELNGTPKFEVLDGQQRLQTIFDFVDPSNPRKPLRTSPKISTRFPNKSFEDLKTDTRKYSKFNAFSVVYDLVHGGSDARLAELFLRLQEGLPLNPAEKLNAVLGKMRDFVVTESERPFFANELGVGKGRFSHRYIVAQLTLMQKDVKISNEDNIEFPSLRYDRLKKMYDEFDTAVPNSLKNKVDGTINFLHETLGTDARVINKKSDSHQVYYLASYLRTKFVLGKTEMKLFRDFIVEFLTEVANRKVPEKEEDWDSLDRYKDLRRKGLTPQNFSVRFRILLGEFFKKATSLQPKDNKRKFDLGQKFAIYYVKDKEKCQVCNESVSWKEASFHHIKFFCNGGLTTVDNGQLMHEKCHVDFHKTNGIDSE